MDPIEEKLNELAEVHAQLDALALEKQALIDTILTPEIKAKLAEIDAEFSGKAETASEKATALETVIKDAVKATGATVKGAYLQAVWSKPRVTWDTKGMDGYAVTHPEILFLRKEGEPSVSIRKVG